MAAEDRPERGQDPVDDRREIDRLEAGRLLAQDPQAGRIESTVGSSRSTWRSASSSQWPRLAEAGLADLRTEQLEVGANDRERRPERVGDDRDQVGAGLVDGAEAVDLGLGLRWRRPFSTRPARSAASVSRKRTSLRLKTRRLDGLDVEHADDLRRSRSAEPSTSR